MTQYNLTCAFCNKSFCISGKPKQRYCSVSCGSRSRRKQEPNLAAKGWNTEFAYIAGLIWSDGCLSRDNSISGFRITLTMTDRALMQAVHKIVSPKRKLYCQSLPNRKPKYSVITQNPDTINFLVASGLTERKSKQLSVPSITNEANLAAFVRGYFDGDGSIFYTKKNAKYLGIRFTCANKSFLEWLQGELSTRGIELSLTKDSRKDVWYLSVYNAPAIKRIAQWLYADSGLRLNRKYKMFQDNDMV